MNMKSKQPADSSTQLLMDIAVIIYEVDNKVITPEQGYQQLMNRFLQHLSQIHQTDN